MNFEIHNATIVVDDNTIVIYDYNGVDTVTVIEAQHSVDGTTFYQATSREDPTLLLSGSYDSFIIATRSGQFKLDHYNDHRYAFGDSTVSEFARKPFTARGNPDNPPIITAKDLREIGVVIDACVPDHFTVHVGPINRGQDTMHVEFSFTAPIVPAPETILIAHQGTWIELPCTRPALTAKIHELCGYHAIHMLLEPGAQVTSTIRVINNKECGKDIYWLVTGNIQNILPTTISES